MQQSQTYLSSVSLKVSASKDDQVQAFNVLLNDRMHANYHFHSSDGENIETALVNMWLMGQPNGNFECGKMTNISIE